jgi:hypothetical protein
MYKPVQTCTNCGAGLTLDDMRKTDCPYCGTVYPHHSQAAQHALMANQMMGQLMQQVQQPMQPPGQPPYNPYAQPGTPPPPGAPGSPYGDPMRMMQAQMQYAQRTSRNIMLVVTLGIVGTFVLIGVIMALSFAF